MAWLTLSIVAVLVLVGLAAWRFHFATYHLATVQDGALYRCGNRGVQELSNAIGRTKARTVVSLIDDQELADNEKPQFREEAAWCAQHGVKLVRLPIPLGGWPTTQDVQSFLSVVSDKANQPVMFHCAQGVRRTGMLAAAYQMSVQGYDKEKAKSALLAFGHSNRTVGDVQRFIDVYDANSRVMTVKLENTGRE